MISKSPVTNYQLLITAFGTSYESRSFAPITVFGTCVALAQAAHDIVILDNLSNSQESVLDRLEILCGTRPQFIHGDVRDAALLDRIFAGLKAVGECLTLRKWPPASGSSSTSSAMITPLG